MKIHDPPALHGNLNMFIFCDKTKPVTGSCSLAPLRVTVSVSVHMLRRICHQMHTNISLRM